MDIVISLWYTENYNYDQLKTNSYGIQCYQSAVKGTCSDACEEYPATGSPGRHNTISSLATVRKPVFFRRANNIFIIREKNDRTPMGALIAVAAGSFGAGLLFLNLLRIRLPLPYLVALVVPAGLMIWCIILFCAGYIGLLSHVFLWSITAVTVTAAVIVTVRRRQPPALSHPRFIISKVETALLLFIAAFLLILLLCCFAPVTGGIENDEIHTHMSISSFWLQHNKIIPQSHPISFMAGNGELLFSWGMAFSREHGARIVSWLAFLVVVIHTYILACNIVGRTQALTAAAMVAMNPLLFRTSSIAFVDTLSIMFMLVSVNEYLRFRRGGEKNALFLAFAFAGTGCGVKPTIVIYSAVFVVLITVDSFFIVRKKKTLMRLLTALFVLIATAAPWPMATLIRTGSPTFPPPPIWYGHHLDSIFRKEGPPYTASDIEGFYQYVNSRYGSYRISAYGFLRFSWDLTMRSGQFQAGDSVGTILLSFLPLVLTIAVWHRLSLALFLCMFSFLSSAGIYFGILPEARYFATAYCLLAPVLSLCFGGHSLVQRACVAVFIINAVFSFAVLARTGSERIGTVINPAARERFRIKHTPYREAFAYCNGKGKHKTVVVKFDSPIWYYLKHGYTVDSLSAGTRPYGMDTLLLDIDYSQLAGKRNSSRESDFCLNAPPAGMRLVFDGGDAHVYTAEAYDDE